MQVVPNQDLPQSGQGLMFRRSSGCLSVAILGLSDAGPSGLMVPSEQPCHEDAAGGATLCLLTSPTVVCDLVNRVVANCWVEEVGPRLSHLN